MVSPLNETVWQRANKDTLSAFHTLRFWLFDILGVAIFSLLVLVYTPSWVNNEWKILYQVLVPVFVGVIGLGVLYLVSLIKAPYLQCNEARTLLKQSTKLAEKTSPRIIVTHHIHNDRAILEVNNIGAEAQFTAKGRILEADIDPELFTMYWESNKENTCHIDAGGKATILVSGISKIVDETRNLYKNGLMLYKMGTSGEQVFGARSLEKRLNFIQTYGIKVPEDDKYIYINKCIVEIEITSSPPLSEPFGSKRYQLEVKHENEYLDRFLFNSINE
jgi:hypothetical protein